MFRIPRSNHGGRVAFSDHPLAGERDAAGRAALRWLVVLGIAAMLTLAAALPGRSGQFAASTGWLNEVWTCGPGHKATAHTYSFTDEQRHVFEQLSVFRGSFTRDAAAAVAGADLRLLFELAAKSLVRRLDLGRYELHELLRQYAADKLALDSEGSEAALERHARFYVGLLESRRSALLGPHMAEARDEVRGEVDNLRTAVEWAAVHWDDDEARSAFDSLNTFFWMHSWFEGAESFERISGLLDGRTSLKRVSALVHQTDLVALLGYDEGSEKIALESLPQVRELGLTRELGKCLLTLGTFACHRDAYPDAIAFLEEAEHVTRATGDPIEYLVTLIQLGWARLLMANLEAAREAFQTGYEAATEIGNPLLRAYLVTKLGLLADAEGDFESAMGFHQRGQDLFTSVGDVGGTGYTLSRSSMSAYCLGDYPEAMRLGRAGFEAFSAVNHRWGVISALCRMGFAAVGLGEFAEARRDFLRALELAQQSKAQSLVLHALSGAGALLPSVAAVVITKVPGWLPPKEVLLPMAFSQLIVIDLSMVNPL